MIDYPADLPSKLQSALDRRVRARPELAAAVERLLAERNDSPDDKARFDELLWSVAQPARGTRMIWVICLAPIVLVPLYQYFSAQWRASQENQRVAAIALIEASKEGFCWFGIDDTSCIALRLRVVPPTGPAYRTELVETISDMYLPRVQAGQWVHVAVSPSDTQDVLIRLSKLAEPPPLAPPQLGPPQLGGPPAPRLTD